MAHEVKIKKDTHDACHRIASLFTCGHEIAKQICLPMQRRLELVLNSLQKEMDDLIKINGNGKGKR